MRTLTPDPELIYDPDLDPAWSDPRDVPVPTPCTHLVTFPDRPPMILVHVGEVAAFLPL